MIQRFRQIFRINAVEMFATSSTLQMEKGGYKIDTGTEVLTKQCCNSGKK
jgi:hypothetical protein